MREGWEIKSIDEACEILDNKRKPITKKDRVEGDYPYYGATGVLSYVEGYIFDEKLVLLGEDGAKWESGDKSAFIIHGKTWVNNHAHVLKPNRDLLFDEWLTYNLNFQNLMPYVSGMTVPKLNQGNMKKIEIPTPPLEEQKEIVSILDDAFASIDKAKANIERNIENAKELFQSKLNEIFSQTGEGWEEKKLMEITNKIGSGATPRGGQASYKEIGISLIRSMNVHDDGFRHRKLAFIDDEQASKLDNVTIHENDVLLNITGASVARCCIVDSNYLPARVNQHVSIIRLKEGVMSCQFLHYALTSKVTKDLLLGIGELGSTRQAITKVQIENFSVKFPKSIDVQNKLVRYIDFVKIESEKLESAYQIKLESLEDLKKSILQKAFSGELTNKTVAA